MLVVRPGQVLQFRYENYLGEVSFRNVVFQGLDYGENTYYLTPQWLLRTFCLDRQALRSFALANIDMSTFKVIG